MGDAATGSASSFIPDSEGASSSSARRVLGLLAAAYVGLFCLLACPQMADARLTAGGIVTALLALTLGLVKREARNGRSLGGVAYAPDFQKTVLVQACVQGSVFVYWGAHDPMVVDHLPSLLFQLLFAPVYYFTCCVVLGQRFRPGFWLLAIVFSINFFIWFRYPFFVGQILLLLVAIPAKMLVTREEGEGKRSHVFNPSGIVLSLGSLVILVLSLDRMVVGQEIVHSFFVTPHFGLFLFLVGCVSQWLPSLYLIPLGAVAFLTVADMVSVHLSGMPLMVLTSNSSIFLGITLLITDPRTSPKSQQGRLLFGIAYGFSIALAFALLSLFHKPSYFDKVLFVPVLNFLAPYFDRIRWPQLRLPAWSRARIVLALAYVPVFAVFYPRFAHSSPGPFLLRRELEDVTAAGAPAGPAARYQVTHNFEGSVEGDPQRIVRMQTVTFPPGTGNRFHRHPGDQWEVIEDGELVSTIHGQTPRILKAGDSLFLPRGTVHRNQNLSGAPARSVEVLVLDRGKPQTEVVPE